MNLRTAVACVPVKSFVEYSIATRLIPRLLPSWVMKSAKGFGHTDETGSDINAVPSANQVIINIPKYKYRAIPIGSDGDLVTYSIQTAVMYDDTLANPFEVTVVNDTPAYLVSS